MSEEIKYNGTQIDLQKVQKLLQKIIIKENNNLKTKDKNDSQMVKMIQDLNEEEVKCY